MESKGITRYKQIVVQVKKFDWYNQSGFNIRYFNILPNKGCTKIRARFELNRFHGK